MSKQTIQVPQGATEVIIETVDSVSGTQTVPAITPPPITPPPVTPPPVLFTKAVPAATYSFTVPEPPDNQAPVVSAGANQTITLPTNSVTLNGSGTDPDGVIVSYQWQRVSGSGTINTPGSPMTLVSALLEGTSVFSLTATDNDGAINTSTTTITIKPDTTPPPDGSDIIPDGFTLTYSNGYDSTNNLNSNQLGRGTISTSKFKTGPGSFKSQVNPGDGQISGGWRSEQQYSGNLSPNNRDIIVIYDELIESMPGVNGLTCQWHGNTSGTSGQMSMWYGDGKFMVQRNITGTAGSPNIYQDKQADGSALITPQLNKWYHFRWEIRFSTGSDGYVRLYLDSKLYFQVAGKTCDGSGQYFKPGQNLFSSPRNTSILYIDNLKIYLK